MKSILPHVVILSLLILLSVQLFNEPDGGQQEVQEAIQQLVSQSHTVIPPGGPFTLQGVDGPVSLSDFRGKLVVIYFGYTWCPDVCPTNLGILAVALNSLSPAEQARIQPIFISVDPGRDDPARLAKYAEFYLPNLIGLTGTPQQLRELASRYGVVYRKVEDKASATAYTVDHSSNTYLLDSQGKLQAMLTHATAPSRVAQALRELLAREFPTPESR